VGIAFNVEIEEFSATNEPLNKIVELIGVVSPPVINRTRESKGFTLLTDQTSTSIDMMSNVVLQFIKTSHGGCLLVFINPAYLAEETHMANDMKRLDA
jgi:hypothetical protein